MIILHSKCVLQSICLTLSVARPLRHSSWQVVLFHHGDISISNCDRIVCPKAHNGCTIFIRTMFIINEICRCLQRIRRICRSHHLNMRILLWLNSISIFFFKFQFYEVLVPSRVFLSLFGSSWRCPRSSAKLNSDIVFTGITTPYWQFRSDICTGMPDTP